MVIVYHVIACTQILKSNLNRENKVKDKSVMNLFNGVIILSNIKIIKMKKILLFLLKQKNLDRKDAHVKHFLTMAFSLPN